MSPKVLVWGLLALCLIGGLTSARYLWRYPDRAYTPLELPVIFEISRGQTFDDVADLLAKKGIIRQPLLFRVYARLVGATSKVRAGEFRIDAPITPRELLDELTKAGRTPQRRLVVREGVAMREIADLLDAAGICSARAFLDVATDPMRLAALDLETDSAEGFLFPETYLFDRATPAVDVLRRLVAQSVRAYDALSPLGPDTTVTRYGWSRAQVFILASIVEAEAKQSAEQPLIASVFVNRLTDPAFKPSLLQADPTVMYGCTYLRVRSTACESFVDRLRRVHLSDGENPYNTYVHPGLPPGPIGNPGRGALAAALRPAATPYLYFVARNDGTHQFSATYAEHLQAVRAYQLGDN